MSLLASGLAACRRGAADGPSCGAVGAKFFAIATVALEASAGSNADNPLRRAVADQIPAMRDSLVITCTESKWSAAVRDCLTRADDRLAFEACEQQLTDDQRRALDLAARGETAGTPSR